MEKQQAQQTDQVDSLQEGRDERVEDVEVEPVQHIHLKTIVLLIVSSSFYQILPCPPQQYSQY